MTSTLKKISRRVALTLAVSACFSPVTQAAELLTEGVFKVGMEVTYPPFESYDSNNNIVGLDPDFAALIAQHLQAKPQLIDTKFTSLILGIGKKYDAVISGMYVTPERQKQADAIPYALSGASIIALVAIFKSFFGHYLGTLEGLNGLILRFGYKGDKTRVSSGKLNTLSMVFIMGSTWVVAYANPNILDLIEAMGAPIIASLLCLLPMYAIRKAPSLAKYRGRLDNLFVSADHPQHRLQTVLIRLRPRGVQHD